MSLSQHQDSFESLYSSHPLFKSIQNRDLDEWGIAYKSPFHKCIWWSTFENIYSMLNLSNDVALLNIGIGFGFDEKVIKARSPEIRLFGIDISPSMIKGSVLNDTPAMMAVATSENLPFPRNTFERIISREVIEHVYDPNLYLRQIRDVAARGCRIVITTPNGDSLALEHILAKFGIKPKMPYKDDHMRTKELERLFKANGFEILERFFDCPFYFWLSILYSKKPFRGAALFLLKLTRPLAGHDFLSKLTCDQVKYLLTCTKDDENYSRDKFEEIKWVCPACKGALDANDSSKLKCRNCNTEYYVIDGKIPCFIDSAQGDQTAPNGSKQKVEKFSTRKLLIPYSLVCGMLLVVTTVVAWLCGILRRSSKPFFKRS